MNRTIARRQPLRRTAPLLAVILAISALTLGLVLARNWPTARQPAAHGVRPAAQAGAASARGAGAAGVRTRFPHEQLSYKTLSGPVSTARADAKTPAAVQASFARQSAPRGYLGKLLTSRAPTVTLAMVTDQLPQPRTSVKVGVPYQAWVVTYTNVPIISFGPTKPAKGATQDFVGIMDTATGKWTEFFTDRPGK